jgi:hypothetical protein
MNPCDNCGALTTNKSGFCSEPECKEMEERAWAMIEPECFPRSEWVYLDE